MLRPKFDSTLLIAASTCHGMPYVAPGALPEALSDRERKAGRLRAARGTRAAGRASASVRHLGARERRHRRRRGNDREDRSGRRGRGRRPPSATTRTASESRSRLIAPTAAQTGSSGSSPRRFGRLGGLALGRVLVLERVLERDEEVVPVRGGVRRDLAVDLAGDDERDQRLLERLHVEERALADRLVDLVGACLADQVGDSRVRDHHLERADPPAGDAREEPLADDAAQDAGEDRADLLLLDPREELDHAADRLGGVDGVHGREDEVARLGRLQRGLGRLGVAELSDQDHVGVLAQRAAERLREGVGVEADLALVDDAAVVGVQELDRVLDRDDVLAARAVDVVDRATASVVDFPEPVAPVTRTRPRCSSASRADSLGQAQLRRSRDLGGDDAEGERGRAALLEAVDAEAREVGRHVRGVELARLAEAARAAAACRAVTSWRTVSRSASPSGCQPSSAPRSPSQRTTGGRPSLRCMSVAPMSTTAFKSALSSMASHVDHRQGRVR